jgi:ubiquinone/menaquinone biosynthesis C-methylase UbiE
MRPRDRAPADWQLPPGVNRGLWEYMHDLAVARGYDASLAGTPLFAVDQRFVEEHCPRSGRLIDLGCGTGRLLIPLAQRGFRVLGVDLSQEMLTVARHKARDAGVVIDLLQANLTELDGLREQSFDYATCLFSTLGMVVGAAQRRQVVAHAFRLLRPGGRLLLHVHNRWFNFWDPVGRRWLLRDCLKTLTPRTDTGDRVMPVHQGIAGLTLHLFTRREVVRLLQGVGFRVVELRPISLRADGCLPSPGWFGWLRAYGYLLAAERPGLTSPHEAAAQPLPRP